MPRIKCKHFMVLIFLSRALISAAASAQDALPQPGPVEALKVLEAYLEDGDHLDNVTLVVLMERSGKPEIFSLEEPLRLIVDIPNACADKMLPGRILPRSSLFVTGIRVGENQKEKIVRFVFDLRNGNKYDVTPRLFIPEGENSQARLLVTVSLMGPKEE